ncbi:ATP-binding protein [Catenulispora sp. GP43]|uniref:ATP-binding protein n=1 Tax=Catenulispora sp. GP43 TaxID=3156263 RepID=UPI0035192C6B
MSHTVTRAPAPRPTDTRGIGGIEFPYTPESVGTARHALADALQRMRVAPSAADDAVLILSELVSNALRHALPLAGGTIRVAWWMADDKVLRIAVTDGGRQQPAPDPRPQAPDLVATDLDDVDESAVDGRGLGIVGLLADSWGVEPWYAPETEAPGQYLHDAAKTRTGPLDPTDPSAPKTVWAAVRLHARHAAPPPPDDHDRRWWRRMRVALTAHLPGTGRGRMRGRLGGSRLGEARGGPDGDAVGSDTAWVPRYPEARVGCAAAA